MTMRNVSRRARAACLSVNGSGIPSGQASARADACHSIGDSSESSKKSRLSDRLRRLALSWAQNRAAFTEMAQRIAQLQAEKRALEEKLATLVRKEAASSHDANHDALTGLPNRVLLQDRFQQATANADRRHTQVIVVFLDVDRFKQVNDRFGHSVGDRVLQMVAARIQANIRVTDTACRYGGDEFVVLLTDIGDSVVSTDMLQELQCQLARPYWAGADAFQLRCSIGVATYPRDGLRWEVLLARADESMYRTKPAHRRG